ncbi:uncharacterized protein DFL_003547 [Arthrobotrys flagrans]|uniref:DUF833-domain-containing protein n=1 Tax=Arthrobotrys flagrans TaxID=97331 RepID=A0A437A2B0_ARTFL|nr:hypothetical protein DFL_003547 [Arthrobotrys flagrans]
MCILLWTTACANKGYPLILLSNRDEFLQRPTQTAGPWDKDTYGGRDLARPENDAISTCYSWTGLGTQDSDPSLDIDQVGGFSMLCGQFSRDHQNRVQIDSFGVISNRAEGQIHGKKHDIIDPTEPGTYGLSNSAFTNPWPKVLNGKRLLDELVEDIQNDRLTDREISQKGIEILTSDSVSEDEAWKDRNNRLELLKQSVFIPMFETRNLIGSSETRTTTGQDQDQALSGLYNLYGTQKQTVIIVHESGAVRYTEKTLYDWLQGTTDAANDTVDIIFDLDL